MHLDTALANTIFHEKQTQFCKNHYHDPIKK